ncbi:MAG: hypothetical protein ACXABG_01015 [Promethearchaeota archaeon]|jgi:hypothetical protein
MNFTRKITVLKGISIIPFLFACIPLVFVYLFLRDIPILNSMFVDYVNSGTSVFFPDLPFYTIVFNFTTSHLIDIIIILNVIASLERTGYHYYVNVCLRRNDNVLCLEPYYLGTYETQEDTSQDLNLIYGLEDGSGILTNESSDDYISNQKSKVTGKKFSNRGYDSSILKTKCNSSNFLYDPYRNNNNFQDYSVYVLINSYLPSIKTQLIPNSYTSFDQKEGIL